MSKPIQSDAETRAKRKAHYVANRERLLAGKKRDYESKREVYAERNRKQYLANRETRLRQAAERYDSAKRKAYVEANRDKINAAESRRWRTNEQFRLGKILRSRLRIALRRRNISTPYSGVTLLGCSIDEALAYLESLFVDGMTWENQGYHGWHVDHVRPLNSFDLTDPEQVAAACHYTNLQPLWAKDNLRKGWRFNIPPSSHE